MLVTDYWAYTDIIAELSQNEETLVITLKGKQDTDINLTLNYLQTKVLAENLLTIVNQIQLQDVDNSRFQYSLGDIKVIFDGGQL